MDHTAMLTVNFYKKTVGSLDKKYIFVDHFENHCYVIKRKDRVLNSKVKVHKKKALY